MILFCFPYAGGNGATFNEWPALIPKDIQIIPIHYPGRGIRFNEPLQHTVSGLVDVLYQELSQRTGDQPYSFFGHSLGSLIAFELIRRLRPSSYPLPQHLIVSGAGAPQFPEKSPISHLPDAAFMLEVQNNYQGFHEDLSQSAEVMALFTPILRADFSMSESYLYKAEDPLDCTLSVFNSINDPMLVHEELLDWQKHSTKKVNFYPIPGDHFSLLRNSEHRKLLLGYITRLLKSNKG